LIILGRGERW